MVVGHVVELVHYAAVSVMNSMVITDWLKLLVKMETRLPVVVNPVVTLIKQHQRLHVAPGTGRKTMLDYIVSFALLVIIILLVRSVIVALSVSGMIDFYYSDHSGWDTHQKSFYEAIPNIGVVHMTLRFWVWPVSRFYPEYRQFKRKGNPS